MGVFGIRLRGLLFLGFFGVVAFACSDGRRTFRDDQAGSGRGGSMAAGSSGLAAGSSGTGGGSSGSAGRAEAGATTGGSPSTGGASGSGSTAGGSTSTGGASGSGAVAGGGGDPAAEAGMGGMGADDPCDPQPCVHGTCEADGDSYSCECEKGYRGDDCELDIDECADGPCTHGTCIDAVAAFQCDCGDTGYTGNLCETLIQNCEQTPCLNGGACTDVGASRTCDCAGTGATGVSCEVDINECDADPCEHGTCANGKNQYTCNCAGSGYTGTDCDVDIDECDDDPCDPLTNCSNSPGGFSCSNCPSGYSGSGLSGCSDVNECSSNNGGCDTLTTCTNTTGGRTCSNCPSGYTGNGATGCSDVNECSSNNGGCDALTTCTNTTGSRSCGPCPNGYSGTGTTGCTNINDCAGSPCKNGGTCVDGINAYTCNCTGSWSGSTCQNATLTISASARGFYANVDWLPPGTGNTLTGWGGGWLNASYFVFPIPNFTGKVSSVTLLLEHEVYDSPDASEIVTVRDVSTSISTLTTNTQPSLTIYQDLSSGTQYGTLSGWSQATVGTIRSFALSGAITPVSNVRGSSFAIGVNTSPVKVDGVAEYIRFSFDTEARTHQLQVVVVPP
jgi:hypothetical protein